MPLTLFKDKIYKDYLILLYGIPFIALVTTIVGMEYSLNYIFRNTTFWWKVLFTYIEVMCIWVSFRLSLVKIDQYFPFTVKNSKQRLIIQMVVMFVLYAFFRLLFIPINELFFNHSFNWRIHFNSDLPIAITFIILINLLYYHWIWTHLIQGKVEVVSSSPNDFSSSTKSSLIPIQRGKKTNLINVKEIAYFYKKDSLTYLKQFNGEVFLIDESLKSLINTYHLEGFYRVNRQFIIHYAAIQSFQTLPNRQVQIILQPASPIVCKVNKNNVKAFKVWLKKTS